METLAALVRNARTRARVPILVAGLLSLVAPGPGAWAKDKKEDVAFEVSRIFIEYNSTDNDLGFHVALDGEDWKTLRIVNPKGRTIADLQGRAGGCKQHSDHPLESCYRKGNRSRGRRVSG